MRKWTFNPVDEKIWSQSQVRVMLLGAEPNGDSKYTGPIDMGEWFSTATPYNSYSKNRRFFTNNVAQLCGALNLSYFNHVNSLNAGELDRLFQVGVVTKMLKRLRYVDLKATGGASIAETDMVEEYVLNNLNEVLDFWNPDGAFLPPTLTVVQGNHAHRVFMALIRPELFRRGWSGKYLGMLHPSHQGSYENSRRGLKDMQKEFKPFSDSTANRWNGNCWVQINKNFSL